MTAEHIKFCDENIRPVAEDFLKTYYKARILLDRWNALGYNESIPNDSTLIPITNENDDRPRISGSDAHNVVNVIKVLEQLNTQNNWLTVVHKSAVNIS